MSSSPTISFSGLASGIDTTGVITQLTATAQKPITLLQGKQTGYNAQLTDWQSFNSQLSALQAAANTLNTPSTYSTATAGSSDITVATITSQVGTTLGTHSLTVTQLAQAQKVVSNSVSSSSTALGKTGSFTLNGKTITVSSADALADIAVKINGAGAGVNATVVNVGTNDYRITLTSNKTGAANSIAAADSGGTVLSGLGLIQSGPAGIRQAVTYVQGSTTYTGAAALTLGSATQSVGSLLGIAAGSAPSGTFHLSNGGTGAGNEADVAVNLNTASLTDVANAINQAGISGVTAEVVTVPDANGNLNRIQQLRIVSSTAAAPTFTDTSGVLSTLGVQQNAFQHTITAAQDAQFNIDGLDLTRATNSVSDVITGATINLLSGTAAKPGTTTLSVAQNTASIVQAVSAFTSAYNSIQDFVTNENKFTPPTDTSSGTAGKSPALFGDTALSQIQQQLAQTLTAVSGTTTLQSVGITLDQTGHLNVDSNVLTSALQADPSSVSNLFGLSGTSDSGDVQFIKGGPKAAASTGAGYAVNITQPATQSSGTAGTAVNTAAGTKSAAPETLTFGGPLFSGSVSLTLPAGSTLQDTVNLINATSSLNTQVYATIDSGNHLVLASQSYGTGTGFTVSSNQTGDGTNSGVSASLSITAGLDVQGTIGGEPATGNGRTLIGNAGNAHTEGIQLLVTATAASPANGAAGHVTLTHGVGDSLSAALTQVLDPVNGAVAGAESSLNSQIADAQDQITKIQTQISTYKDYLTQIFSEMETRVSKLQAQGNAFAASTNTTSSSSSSSKSSSS